MAQKRTKKAAPKKRRATKKKTIKRKRRQNWTPEQKVAMVAYSREHGIEAACAEYGVVESSLYRWRRSTPKPRKTAAKTKTKTNGQVDATNKLVQENRALRTEVARLSNRAARLSHALVESVLKIDG